MSVQIFKKLLMCLAFPLIFGGWTVEVQQQTILPGEPLQVDASKLTVAPCRDDEVSKMAVMSSTDKGKTWTDLGPICMHAPSILCVDCTALPINGGIALYFVDMKLLGGPAGAQRVIYRAATSDGKNFNKPQVVLSSTSNMVDPAVVRTQDGRVHLFVPTFDAAGPRLVLASSDDSLGAAFTVSNPGLKVTGVHPGALLLPDGRVRLFTSTMPGSGTMVQSWISENVARGLFVKESGVRIEPDWNLPTVMPYDVSPIRLSSGAYLMAYAINLQPTSFWGEYRLADSRNGLDWTVRKGGNGLPINFAKGGTSCLVEKDDGTLYFYYGY